jgi:hypothetical protein
VPYQSLADGLYFVMQQSPAKGVDHYGILDIGNRRGAPSDGPDPVVIHQLPPRITANWLHETGTWCVLYKIPDEAAALERLRLALYDPTYAVLRHNCEHFARFVGFGVWESKQVQAAGWMVGGLVTLAVMASGDEHPRPRRRRPKVRRAA